MAVDIVTFVLRGDESTECRVVLDPTSSRTLVPLQVKASDPMAIPTITRKSPVVTPVLRIRQTNPILDTRADLGYARPAAQAAGVNSAIL